MSFHSLHKRMTLKKRILVLDREHLYANNFRSVGSVTDFHCFVVIHPLLLLLLLLVFVWFIGAGNFSTLDKLPPDMGRQSMGPTLMKGGNLKIKTLLDKDCRKTFALYHPITRSIGTVASEEL